MLKLSEYDLAKYEYTPEGQELVTYNYHKNRNKYGSSALLPPDSKGVQKEIVVDGPDVSEKEIRKRLKSLGIDKLDPKPKKGKIVISDDYKLSKFTDTINRFLDDDDAVSASSALTKRMLQSIVEMLPVIEENFRDRQSTTYVYALNTMIGKAQDLMYDLTDTDDSDKLYKDITTMILLPAFLALSKNLLLGYEMLMSEVSSYVTCSDDKLKTMFHRALKEQISYIDTMTKSIESRLKDRMGINY